MQYVSCATVLLCGIASCLSARGANVALETAVIGAFRTTYDGWSSDEVLLDDERLARFQKECLSRCPDGTPSKFNWALLTLRKQGKLGVAATKRRSDRHDDYLHAAEIAARFMHDKHKVSTDRVLCDPVLRAEFDRVAIQAAPDVDPYLLRKAAFALRKSRRLRPELVVRIADWGRDVTTVAANRIVQEPTLVPQNPGVYLFRDTTGYLYIGESANLRDRLTKHVDSSDRQSLAAYLGAGGLNEVTVELHAFDPDSRAKEKTIRRAYESELIRSRKPRFNVAP